MITILKYLIDKIFNDFCFSVYIDITPNLWSLSTVHCITCEWMWCNVIVESLLCYSSTLTIRILKNRYLAHVQSDALSPEAKSFMKQVVEEEIIKMKVPDVSTALRGIWVLLWFTFSVDLWEDNDNSGSEVETKKVEKKRKRTNELSNEEEDESVAKKPRQSPSSAGKPY